MRLLERLFRKALNSVDNRGGWFPIVREPFAGAWQRNIEWRQESPLTNPTLFRCVTLIAGDVAKLRIRLVEESKDEDGVWNETESPAYSPVLRKPNDFQNRIQFLESWVLSKTTWGNTYALKQRDARNVVTRLYVLDPQRCKPLVADDGSVFYDLRKDALSGVEESVVVPAREIIHDRYNTLFHPLVGLSPIFAAALPAIMGIGIQEFSASYFRNSAAPSGVLTAPGTIKQDTAERLEAKWRENYTGDKAGSIAVLGDGLKYEAMSFNPLNSQLIEQLRWTSEAVAACYGVPFHKVGVGQAPSYNNIEALSQQYYEDCLQIYIESIECCLDEGLEVKPPYGTEFDLDTLLRMDTSSMVKSISEAVTAGVMKPNEGRAKLGYGPVEGGDTPYLQQQNYSLAALARRDAQETVSATAPAEVTANSGANPATADPAPLVPTPNARALLRGAIAAREVIRCS